MHMQIKLTVLAAIAATSGLVLAQDVQVVKIGHVAPISGAQAHYGKDNENGVRMAIEELNAQNISIGGKRIRFEIQAEDDAADPKQGAAAAQKLCDAKVAGVVGHLNSGTTIPASKVYNDCGIPHVTGAATNPNLTKPGYKTTYRIIANDLALGAGLAFYASDALKLKKVAVIDDRTAYGQGVAEVFKNTAKTKGMTVVAEEFTTDLFFKTGDVGRMDETGRVTIVGRSKDLIISGGYNVYPAEIEGYINEMPGVAESAVVGVPHPDFGEAVVAIVVPRDGQALDGPAIAGELKARIANFKVPKQVFVVDELPRNAMGKVQKNLLRDQHRALFAVG